MATREESVGKFQARAVDGRLVTINICQTLTLLDGAGRHGVHRGLRHLRLDDGSMVVRRSQGVYLVLNSGEILTSDDPLAQ